MLKKILFAFVVVIVIGGVSAYFYFSNIMTKALPEMQNVVREMIVDSCEESNECIQVVIDNFPDCRDKYYFTEVNIFTFQDKYGKYMANVHKCIKEKSDIELPSLWDYLIEKKSNE